MTTEPPPQRPPLHRYRERRARAHGGTCCCCRRPADFCWTCACGFTMCQDCMDENAWGMTCNGITWVCPDCGASNDYGNR
jgi:hypothetical protein